MNSYPRALLRFWWLLVLGLAAAALTGTLILYRVDLELPPTELPTLTERADVTYEATLALLVDSPVSPYLRTQAREVVERASLTTSGPRSGRSNSTEGETTSKPPPQAPTELETRLIPDRSSLVRAANFYPLLIESDTVTALREKLTGPIPGVVRARALGARNTGGRTRPSTVPVIQIVAVSPRPQQAIRLVNGTAKAFKKWLTAEQKRVKVEPEQKILLKDLRAATTAQEIGGATYGIPVIASFAVLFGFGALAVGFDRVFPKRLREEEVAPAVEDDAAPAAEPAHLEVVDDDPKALGDAVARIAREVGALRAEAARRTQ